MSDVLGPKPLVNNPNIIAATLSANSSSMRTALGVMSSAEVTSAIESGSGVTSVGVSSTDFTVSGSPVTTTGTISINLTNTGVTPGTYPYPTITIDAKGRISSANSSSPPVTAFNTRTGAVTLQGSDVVSALTYTPARSGNNNDITELSGVTGAIRTPDYIDFDTVAVVDNEYGRVWVDDTSGGLNVGMKGGNVTLQVGQETVHRVTNNTASPMVDGQAVYISGAIGNRTTVALAIASSESTSAGTIGLVTEPISINGQGYVTTQGLVNGLDTSVFSEGQPLYLSHTVLGGLTNVRPPTTAHLVNIGICVRAHATNGSIYVIPRNENRIDELHNVSVSSPTSGQVLRYNSSTSVWENGTPLSHSSVVYVPEVASGQDITATLNSLLPTVAAGALVVFPPNRSYIISGSGVFASMQPGVSINFNSTTLIPPAEFFHVASKSVLRLSTAGTTFSVSSSMVINQVSYTLPNGVTAALGDLLTFQTNNIVIGGVAEVYRWTTKVVKVSGQQVTLNTPAPADVTITSIRVTPMLGRYNPVVLSGLKIDMSACPDRNDPVPFLVWGLLIQYMDKPRVFGCEFLGATSACIGTQFDDSVAPVFQYNTASGYYCLPSFSTASGRLGYGVNFHNCSQGSVENNNLFGNRHHVAVGGFMPGNLVVQHNTIVDDPDRVSDMITAFGVQVDTHEGCIGELIVRYNTQVVGFAAAYARGRHLKFAHNVVRMIDSGAILVALANERSIGSVVIEDNEVTGMAFSNRVISTPTTSVDSIEILRNRLDGGSIMIPGNNIPGTVVIRTLRIEKNVVPSGNRLLEISIASGSGRIHNLELIGNTFILNSASTHAIKILGLTSSVPIGRLVISDNTLDVNSTAAGYFCQLRYWHAESFTFSKNICKGAGVGHNAGNGIMLDAISANSFNITDNEIDTDCWLYSSENQVMPTLQMTGNKIRRWIFEEANATSPFGVGQWTISSNKFGGLNWVGQGLIFRASSTTFWSNTASMITVVDNQVHTTGATAVDINAGHTGNRFVFQGNNFGTGTVVDATSTYYEVTGNYTTGTQAAKGGTIARTDGLYASSAPTSGSWSIGAKVNNYSPTDAAGSPAGWINVTAGTPGIWRAYGVTV